MGAGGSPDLPQAFLVGEEGPWATFKRSELRDVLVRAHECLSGPSIWDAEPAFTVKHAKEAVAIEPFRETGYQLLMRAHAAVGNRAEALRVYERLQKPAVGGARRVPVALD